MTKKGKCYSLKYETLHLTSNVLLTLSVMFVCQETEIGNVVGRHSLFFLNCDQMRENSAE